MTHYYDARTRGIPGIETFTEALLPLEACLAWNRLLSRLAICFAGLAIFDIRPIQPLPQSGEALGPALAQPACLGVIRPSSD